MSTLTEEALAKCLGDKKIHQNHIDHRVGHLICVRKPCSTLLTVGEKWLKWQPDAWSGN